MSTGEKMAKVRSLLDLSKEERVNFLNSFDIMMTDCDGVLWNILNAIPGTGEALNDLEAAGKKIVYVTNNSIRTEKDYEAKVTKIGYKFKPENLVHPISSIIRYLKKINFQGLCYVIGTTYTKNLIREAGFDMLEGPNEQVQEDFVQLVKTVGDNKPVKCVIMDVDLNFGYPKFLRAELYLRDPECKLILGSTDLRAPVTQTLDFPGPGYFTNAMTETLQHGKKAIILGKPGVELGELLKEQYEIKDPKRVLFVGDVLSSDIKFAGNVGYQSLLVLSGCTSREMMLANEDKGAIPDFYTESLADLSTLIKSLPSKTAK